MGLIQFANLQSGFRIQTGDTHEIAATPMRTQETMTLIGREHDGGPLVYLCEIPVKYSAQEREIRFDEAIQDERKNVQIIRRSMSWSQHEVKFNVDADETKPFRELIKPGYHFVRAKWPYEHGFVMCAPFKSSSKKERPELLLDSQNLCPHAESDGIKVFKREDEIKDFVNNTNCDFWERLPKLTAGNFKPALPEVFPNNVRNIEDENWLCGVCADFQSYYNELEQSSEVQDLWRQTRARSVSFTFPQAGISKRIRLYDDDHKDRMKDYETLLKYSIAESLAGPYGMTDGLHGKPVTVNIARIYRGHLNKINERIKTELNKKDKSVKKELTLMRGTIARASTNKNPF